MRLTRVYLRSSRCLGGGKWGKNISYPAIAARIDHPGRLSPDAEEILNRNSWRNNVQCCFARKILVFARLFFYFCKQTLMHYTM